MGDMQWLFSQVKGPVDDLITEADIISSVRFNHDGSLLATGDKGGRVVVFKKSTPEKSKFTKSSKSSDTKRPSQYELYCTFQSHMPEFDYLKSIDIEERINSIRWLHKINSADFLLSTNDKTIKLWKISEKTQHFNKCDNANKNSNSSSSTTLSMPQIEATPSHVQATTRRVYSNAHTYHVNSLAINSDQATFLSADDLRIYIWHYQDSDTCFNVVDIKPENMEDLTELITSADFHPSDCSTLAYSTSKGCVRLCDMRSQALCDQHCKTFGEAEDPASRSFFSEIISSISHISFSPSGNLILSRDYLTLKVWDVRMEKGPLQKLGVHDHLHGRLSTLYEDQGIYDKFEASWGAYDRYILTGSYNSFMRLYDRETEKDSTYECSPLKPLQVLRPRRVVLAGRRVRRDEMSVDSVDYNSKLLHGHWHPTESLMAVASSANLYFLGAKTS